jgi:hypothetical protein
MLISALHTLFSSGHQANEVTLGKCLFGLLKAEFMYICAPGGKIVFRLVFFWLRLNEQLLTTGGMWRRPIEYFLCKFNKFKQNGHCRKHCQQIIRLIQFQTIYTNNIHQYMKLAKPTKNSQLV